MKKSHPAVIDNKFHQGNSKDGKHYWLTPPDVYARLSATFGPFDYDPCPHPKPAGYNGLICEWGKRNFVNPPFGCIIHNGRKTGITAWIRKAIEEQRKGNFSLLLYPLEKWLFIAMEAIGETRIINLGNVRWLAIEDGQPGRGSGWHIAAFPFYP